MDPAAPPNISDDRTHPGSPGLQEAHDSSRQREATTLPRILPAGPTIPTSSVPPNPPPYSPRDPKTACFMYPSPLPHYPNQPGVNPAFYQPSFLPNSTYPSYTIYMNGLPLGDEQPPLPKDYLVESLLVTIFCCIMSGLFAVMYSHETRAALNRGDIREAEKTSQKARLLIMFSLIFGTFVFLGWISYVVIVVCV
ncbi:proline rich transmembrane protein 1B-like [Carassius carassius]|uniref:proline rich transmembrane protein 1B-like n=1 Tax=Carassius carassius TaxID=217509 RepID=UPI00286871D0|nr:proline rich transmembrane protein 1B-like [Carassius carassius]